MSSGRWERLFQEQSKESGQAQLYAEPVVADEELLFDESGDLVIVLREVEDE